MSAIARQPVQRAAMERAETLRAITVRWEISPAALVASRGGAILNGQAAKLRECSLVVRVDDRAASASLECLLTDGERPTIALVSQAPLARSSACGLEFIEAAAIVELTLRQGDDQTDLLYARTPLLERTLGLPGGVYDAPSVHSPTAA